MGDGQQIVGSHTCICVRTCSRSCKMCIRMEYCLYMKYSVIHDMWLRYMLKYSVCLIAESHDGAEHWTSIPLNVFSYMYLRQNMF